MKFVYQGVTLKGEEATGFLDSEHVASAIYALNEKDIYVQKIHEISEIPEDVLKHCGETGAKALQKHMIATAWESDNLVDVAEQFDLLNKFKKDGPITGCIKEVSDLYSEIADDADTLENSGLSIEIDEGVTLDIFAFWEYGEDQWEYSDNAYLQLNLGTKANKILGDLLKDFEYDLSYEATDEVKKLVRAALKPYDVKIQRLYDLIQSLKEFGISDEDIDFILEKAQNG